MDGDVVCPSVYPMVAPFHVHALLFVYSMVKEPSLCLLVLSRHLSLSSAHSHILSGRIPNRYTFHNLKVKTSLAPFYYSITGR